MNMVVRHTTDDGFSTTCAEELVQNLSDDELVRNPDEDITCPTCKEIEQTVIRFALLGPPDLGSASNPRDRE